ncbi:MAG TPA: CoA-binding protein [Candidatus Saccharimonadales bacterium]|nr:CoA-binding protein [Candidatus Saccharimonadales bacterium]
MPEPRSPEPPDEQLRGLLQRSRTLAVVGLSDRPERASYQVAQNLRAAGYRIIPVNPRLPAVLGEKCYPSLADVPEKVDLVVVFRRPEFVEPVVDEAIRAAVPAVWMQLGVRHPAAARKAREAGLEVVMDRCAWVEYQRLFGRMT